MHMRQHFGSEVQDSEYSIDAKNNCIVAKLPNQQGIVNCYPLLDCITLYQYQVKNFGIAGLFAHRTADVYLHYCHTGCGTLADAGGEEVCIAGGEYIIQHRDHGEMREIVAKGPYTGITMAMDSRQINDYFSAFFQDDAFDCGMSACHVSAQGKFRCRDIEQIVLGELAALCRGYANNNYKFVKLKMADVFAKINDLQQAAPEEGSKYLPRHRANKIEEIRRCMEEHLDLPITVEWLAEEYDLPLSTLKSSFKSMYGVPVHTYLRNLRLERAEVLLLESNESVLEIANKVGYSNASKFSEAFKARFGVCPSEIRKTASNWESI